MPETDATNASAGRAGDDPPTAGGSGDPDQTADGALQRRRRVGLLAVTALVVFAADLASKAAVVATLSDRPPVRVLGGLLYLTETRNTGAAFSFAEGATLLFTLIAMAVVVVILRTASRLRSAPWAVCLGLILGGAAGNLADRLARSPGPLRGAVVDWISVLDPNGGVWPIFNLADSGIVCGGVLAIALTMFGYEVDGRRGRDDHGRGNGRKHADGEPRDGGDTHSDTSTSTDTDTSTDTSTDTARRDRADEVGRP